ncbi:MAG: hypothetical protein ABIR15_05400 [Chitinophagaceae bacterium]
MENVLGWNASMNEPPDFIVGENASNSEENVEASFPRAIKSTFLFAHLA